MNINHIFIFSHNEGQEADELVSSGLTEGSHRIHPGQGTRNRKFYFHNFFLEILWVHDEEELLGGTAGNIRLWERSKFYENGNSRFGLCLEYIEETDRLFQNCEHYHPSYLPIDLSVEIISNTEQPTLPWTFRMPLANKKNFSSEPLRHELKLKQLTGATFTVSAEDSQLEFSSFFQKSPYLQLTQGNANHLTLEFDQGIQGKQISVSSLDLTIIY